MNKNNKHIVIVVEGSSDKAFIESFLDCEIVITNGSSIPRETIEYLKNVAKTDVVVVLTDPDAPGKRIRNVLNGEIPNLYHAYVDKKYCIKKHKVGIAESDKDHILESLQHLLKNSQNSSKKIWRMADLFGLNLVGNENASKKRRLVEQHFYLGYNNAKSLCQRLNAREITKKEVIDYLKEIES